MSGKKFGVVPCRLRKNENSITRTLILYAVIEDFKALKVGRTLTLEGYLRFYHSPAHFAFSLDRRSWTGFSVAPSRQPQGSSVLFRVPALVHFRTRPASRDDEIDNWRGSRNEGKSASISACFVKAAVHCSAFIAENTVVIIDCRDFTGVFRSLWSAAQFECVRFNFAKPHYHT